MFTRSSFIVFIAALALLALSPPQLLAAGLPAASPAGWADPFAFRIDGSPRWDGAYLAGFSAAEGYWLIHDDMADGGAPYGTLTSITPTEGTIDLWDFDGGEFHAEFAYDVAAQKLTPTWLNNYGGFAGGTPSTPAASNGPAAVLPEPSTAAEAFAALLLIGSMSPRRRHLSRVRVVLNDEIDFLDEQAAAVGGSAEFFDQRCRVSTALLDVNSRIECLDARARAAAQN